MDLGRLILKLETIDKITVNVVALLSFYDENREARRHSNAIKTLAGEELGFALLIEYFRRTGVQATLLNRTCTTGNPKGFLLDGWIEARDVSSETTHYQVEVKSWSMHGVGGDSTPLPVTVTADELAAYKKRQWVRYWSNGQFIEPGLNKVLTPMKRDPTWTVVEPLACVWSAMHPEGKRDAFFSVAINGPSTFQRVWVFSMSSFLRNIIQGEPQLTLRLPSTAIRINWLRTIFNFSADV